MKILNAKKHKYIPRLIIVERKNMEFFAKFRNRFIKGGEFYLLEYKGDGIKEILSTAAVVVVTIADVVFKGAKIVKSLTIS